MKKLNAAQRRIIADFLSNISAGWFIAGVVTTVFTDDANLVNSVINVTFGILLAYISLQFGLYLEKKKK